MTHVQPPVHAPPGGELVLGRYRLRRRLGAGGMGIVFAAHDERLDREVAVKRIATGGDLDARAQREAVAAARLSHPGIVALYEAGRDAEAVYLVSELVRGRTLADLERAGDLSDRDVLRIGVTLCDALAHAHARGVIHRDVKPSNVICPERPDEGGGVAKLTDFGVARMADDDALTRTGDVVGTLAYMAPEQAAGQRVTEAADAYALGLVLYEALAGVNPVRAGNAAATARRVGMPIAPLQRVRRDLPAGLCRAIDWAVLPDARDRADLPELRAALARALPEVDDEPAAIAGSAIEGLPQTRRARRREDERWRQAPAPRGEEDRGAQLTARLVAALAAGAVTGAALAWLGPPAPLAPTAAAVGAAAAVALLPRVGWLLAGAALGLWLAAEAPGLAVLALAAVAPVPVLLPRAGPLWSLPAVAPALGGAALASAWPALAGQASTAVRRAALAALGLWWLLLAEALTGERLLLGADRDALPRAAWEGSAVDAVTDALWPLLSGGNLAVAALWAPAAILLPVLVRGHGAAVDAVAAALWAAALTAGTQALADALGAPPPRALLVGAVVAAVAAVAARAVRGPA